MARQIKNGSGLNQEGERKSASRTHAMLSVIAVAYRRLAHLALPDYSHVTIAAQTSKNREMQAEATALLLRSTSSFR